MFHVKHAPPAADDNPLCGDTRGGKCYLPAGHYPMTAHEDATGRWTNPFPIHRPTRTNQRSNYQ